MLKGISPLITPELIYALCAMGHGDMIVIADANFPAEELSKRDVIRLPGQSATEVARAVLSLIGPDILHKNPGYVMKIDPNDKALLGKRPEIWDEFSKVLSDEGSHPERRLGEYERQDFYHQAKDAFVVVQTGESRLYGNLILYKGTITA